MFVAPGRAGTRWDELGLREPRLRWRLLTPPDALGATGGAGEVRGADTRAAQAAFWREGQGTPEQGLA